MRKIIITCLAVVFLLNCCLHCSKESNCKLVKVYAGENLPTTHYAIDTNQDTTLVGKSGTKLHIYKNSFVDSDGLPFQGNVNVELREATTKEDILLGKMFTVSDGNILESGGMIYVQAKSETGNLKLAENKVIDVEMRADQIKDFMQIYSAEFDSSTNQFNWVKPSNIILKVEKQNISSDTLIEITHNIKNNSNKMVIDEEIKLIEPAKPKKYKAGADTIMSLIFDTASFPELADYRNVKFKLIDTHNFQESDTKTIWMSIDLKKINDNGLYLISFSGYVNKKLVEKSYKVSPVFVENQDYAKAMAEYNKKYDVFEKKKKMIEQKRIEVEKAQKLAEQEQKKIYEQLMKIQAENKKKMEEENKNIFAVNKSVNYVFSLKQLGWANCDRLFQNSNPKRVNVITLINNPDKINEISVSIVLEKEKVCLGGIEKGKNKYEFIDNNGLPFLPAGENAVIFVTGFKENSPYFAIKKIRTDKDQNLSFSLEKTNLEDLKILLKNNL